MARLNPRVAQNPHGRADGQRARPASATPNMGIAGSAASTAFPALVIAARPRSAMRDTTTSASRKSSASKLWAIAMHPMPAALAARTPFTASSITTHSAGVQPSCSAAFRKMSGAGFFSITSSPVITASQDSGESPIFSRFASTLTRSALDATAMRSPAERHARTSSHAPGKAANSAGTRSR